MVHALITVTAAKFDPENLRRDAAIYTLVLWRWCTDVVLPLDYVATAQELREILRVYQEAAGDAFDLTPAVEAIERFCRLAKHLNEIAQKIMAGWSSKVTKRQRMAAAALNDSLIKVSRALVPVNYTAVGPFDQDLALAISPLPGLQPTMYVRSLGEGNQQYHAVQTRLVRERNKVVHAISTAADAIEHALIRVEQGR